ncbi:MAG TPA: hypothetical protein VG347_14650 [Verrucomicrobiae bacterium]|nr:hypothetical protein [Verrucomicrobiae bacterium]
MSAKVRSLKIETVGDFAAGKTKPMIRLRGGWLERAGFKSGHRAIIDMPHLGELRLRFEESGSTG